MIVVLSCATVDGHAIWKRPLHGPYGIAVAFTPEGNRFTPVKFLERS